MVSQSRGECLRFWIQEDIVRMAELEKLCFSSPWTQDMLQEEWENPLSQYAIWEFAGQVEGYAGCWKIDREIHITNVAVHPKKRKQGRGEDLLCLLLAWALQEKAQSATLEVREDNMPAIALYQKLSFVSVGKRPHYYGRDEHALVLWNHDIAGLQGHILARAKSHDILGMALAKMDDKQN